MRGERITGTILLAGVLLFGLLFTFMPVGTAWVQEDGTRVTEEYTLFSKLREVAPAADPGAATSSTTWSYFDAGLDGTGGITLLRLAGPLFVVGLVLALAALITTVIPQTSPSRTGGIIGIFASVAVLATLVLLTVGVQWHLVDSVDAAAQLDFAMSTVLLAGLMVLFVLLATGMGLVRADKTVVTGAATEAGYEATRVLKCPDCSTMVEAAIDTIPICPTCGFGDTDYDVTETHTGAGVTA